MTRARSKRCASRRTRRTAVCAVASRADGVAVYADDDVPDEQSRACAGAIGPDTHDRSARHALNVDERGPEGGTDNRLGRHAQRSGGGCPRPQVGQSDGEGVGDAAPPRQEVERQRLWIVHRRLDPRDPCFRANLYNREGLPAAPFRTDTREFVRYSDHTLSSIVK